VLKNNGNDVFFTEKTQGQIAEERYMEKNKFDKAFDEHKNDPRLVPTNPKDALGVAKVPLHCVSCAVQMEVGLAMMEGGRKYGTHNYREKGVRASVYYDAAMRHIMSYWEGEDIDPDSGLPHIIKAIATLTVLRDGQLMENVVDDRPVQLPDKLDTDRLNEHAKDIIKRYPECAEPFTHTKYPPKCTNGHCGLGCQARFTQEKKNES
jgi:hypothetical protein